MSTNSFAIHVYINIFIHIANVLLDFGLVLFFLYFLFNEKVASLAYHMFFKFECSLIT